MKPLAGIRVLDLTRLLPGAVCTLFLADLGAEVVKIESPDGGDYARWMPPLIDDQSIYFRATNRDKRSAILNLKSADGVRALHRLVERADVLIESFRPGVMDRLGCGWATLRAVNPRLIYCALSGWGQGGPYADRSGHDLNYASLAGLTGGLETPQPLGGQVADMGGAYAALSAILAALVGRGRTGEGASLDISLFEGGLPFVLVPWAEALLTGTGGGQGGLTGGAACYRIYRACDGQALALAALEPKFWGAFCIAVERPDLIPDYLLPERQPYLRAELEGLFAQHPLAHWRALLEPADCCFSVVNPPGALADDPHVQARGIAGVGADGAPWMRSPIRLSDTPFEPGAVPGYGAHTRVILAEASFTPAEIDALIESGAARQM